MRLATYEENSAYRILEKMPSDSIQAALAKIPEAIVHVDGADLLAYVISNV